MVSTVDATFVAPVDQSQNVKKVVEQLEKSGRIETRFTPSSDRMPVTGAWRNRVNHWLFEETLPLWSSAGKDDVHGGFHETLTSSANPAHSQSECAPWPADICFLGRKNSVAGTEMQTK